jgi:hypothetical protein
MNNLNNNLHRVIVNRLMGLLQNGPDLSEQASYVVSNDADESRSVGSGSHRFV